MSRARKRSGGSFSRRMRRPLLPAWARTWRMKWTRQRCQVAHNTFETAAFRPGCASGMTSFTPRRPRQVRLRRNPVQIGSALRCADLHAQHFAAAICIDADRDDHGDRHDPPATADFQAGRVDPDIRPIALDGALKKGLHLLIVRREIDPRSICDPPYPHRAARPGSSRYRSSPSP